MNNGFDDGFDLDRFWGASDYYTIPESLTAERIKAAEATLGYKIPASYLALLKTQNGGTPRNTCFPMTERTSWASDHIAIESLNGIGGDHGIDSERFGSRFFIEEWGYPPIGVLICHCPSGGHDAVMLDYSVCGPEGEPSVVHVDVEHANGPRVTPVADSFAAFVQNLVNEHRYDTSDEDAARDLESVSSGSLSPSLAKLCSAYQADDAEAALRSICTRITQDKGHFSLHGDAKSILVYDILFFLRSSQYGPLRLAKWLDVYETLIVFGEGDFRTGGYAPGFVEDWFDARRKEGRFRSSFFRFRFTEAYERQIADQIRKHANPTAP